MDDEAPQSRIPWAHLLGIGAMLVVLAIPWLRGFRGEAPTAGPPVFGVHVGAPWRQVRSRFRPPAPGGFTARPGGGSLAWRPATPRDDLPATLRFDRTDDAVGAIVVAFPDDGRARAFAASLGLPRGGRADRPLADGADLLARVVPVREGAALVLVDPRCPGHQDLARALRTAARPALD